MGGGKSLLKPNSYSLNSSSFFFKNLFSKIDFKHQNKGAILIEFAFCAPVLILLIYYVDDLLKYSRVQHLMKNAAYYAVGAIQNISQNRENKKITKADIQQIAAMWTLSLPISLDFINCKYLNTVLISTNLTLVEGTNTDKCKVRWSGYTDRTRLPFTSWNLRKNDGDTLTAAHAVSLHTRYGQSAKINQEVVSTNLYKDLHIKAGEIKMILELSIYNNGSMKNTMPIERAFGFNMLKMPSLRNYNDTYLDTWVIFSPQDGIFDPNNPPE